MTCGFQRGTDHLFNGELIDSLSVFPATIPILLTFILLILHLVFRFKKGAHWILVSFMVSAVLILVNYSFTVFSLFS
jgi:hypothetical protein